MLCLFLNLLFFFVGVQVVKNRMMAATEGSAAASRGMVQTFQHIFAKEGWRGFFVGFAPCMLRAFPANGAAFFGYEMANRLLPDKL